jgi:hypothetical protein
MMKEHKGVIDNWRECAHPIRGRCIRGVCEGEPIRTSPIVLRAASHVETENSFYTLGTPAPEQGGPNETK